MASGIVILVPTYEDYGYEDVDYIGERIYHELRRDRDDIEIAYARVKRFGDTSQKVMIEKSLRNKEVYIIHHMFTDAAEHTMIAAEAGQAAKLSDASNVVLFDFYNRYFRQDRRTGREPVTARLVAELYENSGIDHVFTLDAHTEQVQMAFSTCCPIETLPTTRLLGNYLKMSYPLENAVGASPDTGGVKRTRSLSNYLGIPMAVIHKRRVGYNEEVEILNVIGDVDGKDVYIRDDVTTTFGTLMEAAKAFKEQGARDIYACVTHADIDEEAKKRIMENDVKIITTNTIPNKFTEEEGEKFDVVDIAPLIASVINARSKGESIGRFFKTSKDNDFES
jgi:ribose-phosphate pyrophosphokinase